MSNQGPPDQSGKPPAKTIFGYAAPKVPGQQPPAAQPPQGQPPQAQPPQGQPPQAQPPQAPPPQAPPPQGQPPQAQPPQAQPPQAQPPQAPPPQAQPPQQGWQQPPQGQPPQQGWQQPQGQPPQQGWQQPPQGGAPQQGGQQPPQQQGWQQQPPQQQGWGGGQGGDPLAGLAARVPASAPGTIFGIPVARLKEEALQQKILIFAGAALLISIFIPFTLEPEAFFSWDAPKKFKPMIWPILAGVAYLGSAFIQRMGAQGQRPPVPPVLAKWVPLAVAFISIIIYSVGMVPSADGSARAANLGYALLVFGLLARLDKPDDVWARVVLGLGVVCILPGAVEFIFNEAFSFTGKPAMMVVYQLCLLVMVLVALASAAFAIPPQHVPALRSVDAFAPLVTAGLLLWLPLSVLLMALIFLVHMDAGASGVMLMLRGDAGALGMGALGIPGLIPILAYFGVLMFFAPAGYEKLKEALSNAGVQPPMGGHGQPGWQQPGQQPGWQQPGQQPGWQQGQPQQPAPPQQPVQPGQPQPGWQQPGQAQPGQPQQLGQPQQPAPPQQPVQPGQPGQPPGGYPPGGGQGGGWGQQ